MKPTALIWQSRKILLLGIITMGNVMVGSAVRRLGAVPRATVFHWEVTSPKWSPRAKWNFSRESLEEINSGQEPAMRSPRERGCGLTAPQ